MRPSGPVARGVGTPAFFRSLASFFDDFCADQRALKVRVADLAELHQRVRAVREGRDDTSDVVLATSACQRGTRVADALIVEAHALRRHVACSVSVLHDSDNEPMLRTSLNSTGSGSGSTRGSTD